MPEFTYAGPPKSYVETRDAEGVIVGPVSYGGTRKFEGAEKPEDAPGSWPAPDADWFPAGADLPVRLPEEEGAEEEAPASVSVPVSAAKAPAVPSAAPKPAAPPPPASLPAATTPAAGGQTQES